MTIIIKLCIVVWAMILCFGCKTTTGYEGPEWQGDFPAPVPHWTNQPPRLERELEGSYEVSKAMAAWRREHPICAWCGRTNGVAGCIINAHHKLPVAQCVLRGDYQALANPTNFISLCRDPDGVGDHGRRGHGSNGVFLSWRYWNPNAEEEVNASGFAKATPDKKARSSAEGAKK